MIDLFKNQIMIGYLFYLQYGGPVHLQINVTLEDEHENNEIVADHCGPIKYDCNFKDVSEGMFRGSKCFVLKEEGLEEVNIFFC